MDAGVAEHKAALGVVDRGRGQVMPDILQKVAIGAIVVAVGLLAASGVMYAYQKGARVTAEDIASRCDAGQSFMVKRRAYSCDRVKQK